MDEYRFKISEDVPIRHYPARSETLQRIRTLLKILRYPVDTFLFWVEERVYGNMDFYERMDHEIMRRRNNYELL